MATAAEKYGSDDALNFSPTLEPVIPRPILSPSPPPFVSQPRQIVPTTTGRQFPVFKQFKKSRSNRHGKTQATQGDAILIGFLADHKHPETAQRAGDQPLPSDSKIESDSDEDTDGITAS
jgi:hypothetical protein